MSARPPGARQRGATLVELVLAIVIVAVGVAGILQVLTFNTAQSGDPVPVTQAHAVAQSYLEEILLREFADPDGSEAGEDRATYDDVDDYDGLADNGCLTTSAACPALGDCACDQFGDPIDALPAYNVSVDVVSTPLNGVPALRVDVRVTHDVHADVNLTLSGFRTNF